MMKKLLCLTLLLSVLTACAAQPPAEPASTPEPSVSEVTPTESWNLLDENYMPIYKDPCEEIEFPDYEGMNREDFEAKAAEVGYNSDIGPFAAWATSGKYSPSGRYLAYQSNKDCLAPSSIEGFSVFLLDTETGEERVLLSGSDRSYYVLFGWLDDETVLCLKSGGDGYLACGADGSTVRLEGVDNVSSQNGRYFAEELESELCIKYIESDGGITEIARTQFERDQLMSCGISPDGKWVCALVRPDLYSYDREIVLWNTADGTRQTVTPPAMAQGEDAAAISAQWQDNGFAIDFTVSDAPDENGHNELWHYQNALFFN